MRRIILGKETEGLRDLIAAALADAERGFFLGRLQGVSSAP